MQCWQPAYVGLGSNLAGPREQVLTACAMLARLPLSRVVLTSRLYGSRAFGPIVQPDFVNAVAGLLTQLTPGALLGALQEIERSMGRPPERQHWGPRVIDLDLLSYDRQLCREPQLLLPHPGIVERNFVLYPLAEIAPDLDLPGLGRVAELKARLTAEGLSLL